MWVGPDRACPCFQATGVEPDVLVLGKALGGGMPIGAFVAAADHMKQLRESRSWATSPRLVGTQWLVLQLQPTSPS